MRVTQLSTYHLFGGASVAATRLHRAFLAESTVESTLLVGTSNRLETHRPEAGVRFLANNFLAEQTAFGRFVAERLYFLPYERSESVRFQFSPARFGADITFHPAVQQADVLHLHWINFGFLSISTLRALFALNKPIVWTLHDQWAFTGGCHYANGCTHFQHHCGHCPYLKKPAERDLSYRIFEHKTKLFAGQSVQFVTPSQWLADEGKRSTLLHDFPFTVIPNTLDLRIFQPIERREVAERFDLAPGKPRILFGSASVTDPRKGFRFLADALHLLHQQLPELQPEILVFGKGRSYLFDELPYPVQHLGLLTSEEAVVAAYNLADCLVVPSLEDNLPNTILESLACGTPVVGFRTGGIPETIEHRQNGYLAASGSAQELADGLAFILTHPQPENLRQNARQFAETHFSEAVVTRQYTQLYLSIANE